MTFREKTYHIIYNSNTKISRLFDVILLIIIIFSILLLIFESVDEVYKKYISFFEISEWIITIFFSVEYIARIYCIKKPKKYIFSFYGVIDFLSTIPKYIAFFITGTHFLMALRTLRLLRIFRVLNMKTYLGASNNLVHSLIKSKEKIFVFLLFIMILCSILGTIMYLIERDFNDGFNNIPKSIYWAIVTLTTVGYGDAVPISSLGRIIASIIMILGYSIIAVPTGLISAQYIKQSVKKEKKKCKNCNQICSEKGAFCSNCGLKLN